MNCDEQIIMMSESHVTYILYAWITNMHHPCRVGILFKKTLSRTIHRLNRFQRHNVTTPQHNAKHNNRQNKKQHFFNGETFYLFFKGTFQGFLKRQ